VLSIRKGSLSDQERLEIESHVTHTYEFLSKIPWTSELKGVPGIAYGHHEKLNGRGYPRQLRAEGIPIQSRMMTVSDIFDALSASDRPYKKAVPPDKALDILQLEVKDGMLDPILVDLFIEARVFEKTRGMLGGFSAV
jgi:HD-GYP domain-containing protein (c-di-GMP phosphodiesterase class II)